MPLSQFFTLRQKAQTAFHNLCTELTPPKGIDTLLWNGLKFCLERPIPKPSLDTTLKRLTTDIRTKYFWRNQSLNDDDYNPKLYIKSGWDPPKAHPTIEQGLHQFYSDLSAQIRSQQNKQRRQHNLLPSSRKIIQQLKTGSAFIILPTDKNLGPAILERRIYKQRCLQDHLLDATTYLQLTHADADGLLHRATKQMEYLINKYAKTLPEAELTYFRRCAGEQRRIPQFYCTPKVHKKPNWKTRPIVSCINSRMGDLSKWVDVQLQQLMPLCPTYLKDSRTFLNRLRHLRTPPPTAILLTADAVSMYTNINTKHALQTLRAWLTLHHDDLPPAFPIEMVMEATTLIMQNNIFQFDDTYWLQRTGTAMGSNLAVTYATIYYAYHEETTVLPTLRECLLLYGRLIDDAGIILDTAKLPTHVTIDTLPAYLSTLLQVGDLRWEVEQIGKTIHFLDLTIELQPSRTIKTTTFAVCQN